MRKVTVIGVDADDTLWHNETLFEQTHRQFCQLLSHYHPLANVERALVETQIRNIPLFGYGIKSYALSTIEAAIELSQGKIPASELQAIIDCAKTMLAHPVDLIDGAKETIELLSRSFSLVLITKGDLRDQERKIAASGLAHFFAHHEIVSDKNQPTYQRILNRLKIAPESFLMVGNSLRSDVLPVLELGGHAIHIPYPIVWEHEHAELPAHFAPRFRSLSALRELPDFLSALR